MGRCPFGGQTWLYLNWLCGLAASGHEVWYVEDDSVWPYDPKLNMITDNPRHQTFKPLLPVLLRLEGPPGPGSRAQSHLPGRNGGGRRQATQRV